MYFLIVKRANGTYYIPKQTYTDVHKAYTSATRRKAYGSVVEVVVFDFERML